MKQLHCGAKKQLLLMNSPLPSRFDFQAEEKMTLTGTKEEVLREAQGQRLKETFKEISLL